MTSRWAEVITELGHRSRRWLVTGGAGFIGAHLVQALLAAGQRVRVLDNFATCGVDNLDRVRRRVSESAFRGLELVIGDVRDRERCKLALRHVEHVVHLAAACPRGDSRRCPDEVHSVNVDGTFNVLLEARAAGVESVVLASCASVYGAGRAHPRREREPPAPASPYAATKQIAETYAAALYRSVGLRTVALRYFDVVGCGQDRDARPHGAVVLRWLDALLRGLPPVVFGDGSTTRDMCPVDNVVRANLLAALAPEDAMGRVFNIGLGVPISLAALARHLCEGMARRRPSCRGVAPVFRPLHPGQPLHCQADVTLARSVLGYEPSTSLHEGLAPILDDFAQRPTPPSAVVIDLDKCRRAAATSP